MTCYSYMKSINWCDDRSIILPMTQKCSLSLSHAHTHTHTHTHRSRTMFRYVDVLCLFLIYMYPKTQIAVPDI